VPSTIRSVYPMLFQSRAFGWADEPGARYARVASTGRERPLPDEERKTRAAGPSGAHPQRRPRCERPTRPAARGLRPARDTALILSPSSWMVASATSLRTRVSGGRSDLHTALAALRRSLSTTKRPSTARVDEHASRTDGARHSRPDVDADSHHPAKRPGSRSAVHAVQRAAEWRTPRTDAPPAGPPNARAPPPPRGRSRHPVAESTVVTVHGPSRGSTILASEPSTR
jgi:hypothetical protein